MALQKIFQRAYRIVISVEFLCRYGTSIQQRLTKSTYFSVGDYRTGVFADSIFSRFTHPFRGVVAGIQSPRVQVEALAGVSRGETGVDELPLDAGSGPYYFRDSPILRGSEVLFLVSRSAADPSVEVNRTTLVRNRDYQIDYEGIAAFLKNQYRESNSASIKRWAREYMDKVKCPACGGSRLRKESA